MSKLSAEFRSTLKSDLLLLFVAAIWGLAFVAQREGAGHVPPLAFVSIRYLLGALSLVPLIAFLDVKQNAEAGHKRAGKLAWKQALPGGLCMGAVLFAASLLQQEAMSVATAGQAGFITSLYVVLVPLIGILMGKYKLKPLNAISIIIAVLGLYLISVQGDFVIVSADLILVISAFLYALHIILIDYFSPTTDPLRLSTLQFLIAGLLGLSGALIFQVDVNLSDLRSAAIPLLYTGIFSSGVAYTLQIFAQRHAVASHAAIIMSSESVFAAVGGVLFLGELMQGRAIFGAFLMLIAGVISQLSSLSSQGFLKRKSTELDK